MKRTVYVHIGLSKTGTTSIQNFLSENRSSLLEQGILYPNLFGERSGQKSIVAYAASVTDLNFSPFVKASFGISDKHTSRQFRKKFTEKIKDVSEKYSNIATTVLSCELLSQQLTDPQQLLVLKELLDIYFDEIKIIVYLRPQETRLKSMYSQALKMGNTSTLKKFIQRKENYFLTLDLWASVFGIANIDARILQTEFLIGNDLITDFYDRLNGSDLSSLTLPPRMNESISSGAALFLQKFNAQVPSFESDGKLSKERLNLIPYLEKYSVGKSKIFLKDTDVETIQKQHAETNEKVRKLFFPNQPQLFLSEKITHTENQEVTVQEFVEISASLWTEQNKIVNALIRKNDNLKAIEKADQVREHSRRRGLEPGKFGREISSDVNKLEPGERLFEMEGCFRHQRSRLNIAESKFWAAEISHPDDVYQGSKTLNLREKNYELWQDGYDSKLEYIDAFNPLINVMIYDITVEVENIPIDQYNFLMGNGSITLSNAVNAEQKQLPSLSEAHASSISLIKSSSYSRSLSLPNDLPLYLSKSEKLSLKEQFSRHLPHTIELDDLAAARIRMKIRYKPYDPSITVHKFIRIPFLDQYPAKPNMVQLDRPWYKSWDKTEPLVIRGFSVYFAPKPLVAQHLEDIAIYALDKNGRKIPGKSISMNNQMAGDGTESLSLDPMFMSGDLIIEPGEYLSASASLVQGTAAANLAIFVLVEIPQSRVPSAYGAPLFYSQGCVNMDYLRNQYNDDRRDHVSTPLAKNVLQSIALTEVEPWHSALGIPAWPSDEETAEKLYSMTTPLLFID